HLYSHGSALLTTLQQVAAASGTALFITVMTLGQVAGAESGDELGAQMNGVHNALIAGAAISLITVVGVWFLRNTGQTEAPVAEALAEEAAEAEAGSTASGAAVRAGESRRGRRVGASTRFVSMSSGACHYPGPCEG